MAWQDRAACKGKHLDLWHPPLNGERGGHTPEDYTDVAKIVCDFCPVRRDCELEGYTMDDTIGFLKSGSVWGGMTSEERMNGVFVQSERTMDPRYLDKVIPAHTPDTPVDIRQVWKQVRQYSYRRDDLLPE